MVEKPTITQAPSASPVLETGTPSNDPHGLDEPIGVTHRFVIHRIQEGESLGNLAAQYDTSLQAIQDVNYFLPDPVWIDWLVIIPVETTDVIGLPKFEAQIVVTGGVTIEEFAADQDLDPSTLKFYNGLPDAYLLSSGEWLLIPHISQ
ncbi:MAG TPA: LysM peptidoglycan-binding domain-containing protein [Anaerolineales bacterium]|nr:LysM peptidoglycan-binding domain-containing protein [Anaerolineales bacterium]